MKLQEAVAHFSEYLRYQKRYSTHTQSAYQSDLLQFELYLKEVFNEETLTEIERVHIRSWTMHLLDLGLEAKTLHRKIASLRSFYAWVLQQKHQNLDPTEGLRLPKVKKRLPVFIQEPQMEKLFDEEMFGKDFAGIRDQMVLELLYGTGMRLSELIELRNHQVIEQSSIKVLGKGNKHRLIPITPHLQKVIANYWSSKNQLGFCNASDPFIVTDLGSKVYPMLVQRLVKKYMLASTTSEKKSPHVLRHSYATHLLDHGAEIHAIKELLGHSSLAATQIYTHNSVEKLKKAYQQAHPKA